MMPEHVEIQPIFRHASTVCRAVEAGPRRTRCWTRPPRWCGPQPPLAAHATVPAFLAHWAQAYAGASRGELTLVAIAASHYRLAWVHPFLDGNGRMARLHIHLALHALGYTGGLWSPLPTFNVSPGVEKIPDTVLTYSTWCTIFVPSLY